MNPVNLTSAVMALTDAPDELVEEESTDGGNARRMVALHGDLFRYCDPWGKDLIWDGRRWEVDRTRQLERIAKATVRQMYEAAPAVTDTAKRQDLAKWAARSDMLPRYRAMVDLARSEPGITVLPEELDADPYLLNVQNGTLDLRTGDLKDHDPADLLTKMAGTSWDPDATAPRFEQFLREIFAGDAELIRFWQAFFGYCLTGSTKEQVLAFLYGLGANGKSTLLDVLMELMAEYATQSEPELLLARYGNSHPTGLADLHGARLVVTTEVGQGRRVDEVQVKQLTGGDRIKARFMRQDFFEFKPEFKLVIAANHKPIIKGTDHAIWRRIRMVPCTVTIPEEERDPDLPAKLRAELPGILAWAVRGAIDWKHHGLGQPAAVMEATREYRTEMDVMGEFLNECTATGPGLEVESRDLHDAYKRWCEDAGEKALNRTAFGREMTDRGFERGQDTKSRRATYIGLKVKVSEGVSPDFGINTKDASRVA